MGIQKWSENLIIVHIMPETDVRDELKTVIGMVRQKKKCSVVIDFSDAKDILLGGSLSGSLAHLLRLQKFIDYNLQDLVLCGVSSRTMGVFEVSGLDKIFKFVEDRDTALAGLLALNAMKNDSVPKKNTGLLTILNSIISLWRKIKG